MFGEQMQVHDPCTNLATEPDAPADRLQAALRCWISRVWSVNTEPDLARPRDAAKLLLLGLGRDVLSPPGAVAVTEPLERTKPVPSGELIRQPSRRMFARLVPDAESHRSLSRAFALGLSLRLHLAVALRCRRRWRLAVAV